MTFKILWLQELNLVTVVWLHKLFVDNDIGELYGHVLAVHETSGATYSIVTSCKK